MTSHSRHKRPHPEDFRVRRRQPGGQRGFSSLATRAERLPSPRRLRGRPTGLEPPAKVVDPPAPRSFVSTPSLLASLGDQEQHRLPLGRGGDVRPFAAFAQRLGEVGGQLFERLETHYAPRDQMFNTTRWLDLPTSRGAELHDKTPTGR